MQIKTKDSEFDGKTDEELRTFIRNLRERINAGNPFQGKSIQAQIDRIQRIIDRRNRG